MLFYVYIDWTLEQIPRRFYVGKGDAGRVKFIRRNKRHRAISKAYGQRREVVFSTDSEVEALQIEKKLIAEFKTRGDVKGQWGANFTEGGDGVCGRLHDEKTKRQISQKMAGIPKSEETRMKMRVRKVNKRVVQYDLNGKEIAKFPSISETIHQTGISSISLCCRRVIKSAGKSVWRYEGDHFDPKTPYVCTPEHRQKLSKAKLKQKEYHGV